jgi:hypothetical protein
MHYINTTDYIIDGDNFILEIRFKNVHTKLTDICSRARFTIHGKNSFIYVAFHDPACPLGTLVQLSEVNYSKQTESRDYLLYDLSEWKTLMIKNVEKHVSMYMDGNLILKGSYTRSIGGLHTIKVAFVGNGMIDHVKMTDLNTRKEYFDDFTTP